MCWIRTSRLSIKKSLSSRVNSCDRERLCLRVSSRVRNRDRLSVELCLTEGGGVTVSAFASEAESESVNECNARTVCQAEYW